MKLKTPFAKLNKKAEDFAEFKNDAHQASKNFLQFSFEGTPTMAAIAMLSQMQTEVLEYESTALDSLNKITKGVVYEVDQLVAMVQAESNSIVAGNSYEGSLLWQEQLLALPLICLKMANAFSWRIKMLGYLQSEDGQNKIHGWSIKLWTGWNS